MRHIMYKKAGSALILIFLLLSLNVPCFASAQATENRTEKPQKIVVGRFDYPGLIDDDGNGNYSGYVVEYLNAIAEYTGWEYEYEYDSWENNLLKLEKGDIDLVCSAQYTDQRAEIFSYANEPLAYENSILYVRSDNNKYYYNDYATFDGIKIGTIYGYYQNEFFEEFAEKKGFNYQFSFYEHDAATFEALDRGEIDAVLTGGMSIRNGYKIISEFSSDPTFFIVNKDNSDLLDKINEAMASIRIHNPYMLEQLYEKIYGSGQNTITPSFTREEAGYIASSGTIIVGNQTDRYPLCYTDEKDNIVGINIDLMNQISQMSGLRFEYEPVRPGVKAVDYLKQTDAKLFNGLMKSQITTFSPELKLSRTMFSSYLGVVGKKGILLDADAEITFAMPGNYISGQKAINAAFPNAGFISCNSTEDCLKAIENGEADYSLMDKYIANALLQKPYYDSLTLMDAYQMSQETCIAALDTEDPLLLSIINKCITQLGEQTMTDVVAKYTVGSPYQLSFKEYIYKYHIPIEICSTLFILLIISASVYIAAKRKNERKIKEFNKQLQIQNHQLEEISAYKSDFLSRVSHDIRTPMNAIINLTQMIENEIDNKEAVLVDIQKMKTSNQFLLSLVNDILDMSRIEHKTFVLNPSSYSYNEFLNYISSTFEPLCHDKNISLKIKKGPLDVDIMIDKVRFNQLCFNLLSNAIKYTKDGGTVEFHMEHGKIEDGKFPCDIYVSDTGIGMSEEFMSTMFEPFAQEERAYNTVEGTGLGLTIVKEIVDLFGGTIDVKSEINKGSVFHVHMNMTIAEEYKENIENTKTETLILSGKNILVAEDHPLNQEIIKRILNKAGIEVTLTNNGKEVTEEFKHEPDKYDAILMDMRMPVMDGLQAAKAIRSIEHEKAKVIPIIAVSANAYSDDAEKSKMAGINEHLGKPIEPEKLYQVLCMYFSDKTKTE